MVLDIALKGKIGICIYEQCNADIFNSNKGKLYDILKLLKSDELEKVSKKDFEKFISFAQPNNFEKPFGFYLFCFVFIAIWLLLIFAKRISFILGMQPNSFVNDIDLSNNLYKLIKLSQTQNNL